MWNWSLFLAHPTYWQTCDSRKCTELLLMLILSLRDILQNQSLETMQVCIVVLCFPHDKTVGIHLCDECTRSDAPNVCHMLLSTSSPHEQVYSQTTKCHVSQTFENNLWADCRQISYWLIFLFFELMIIQAWSCVVLFASPQSFSTHFCAWPSIS